MIFNIFSLQVRMMAQSQVIGISSVNQVMGCWSAQTGCPAAIEPVDGRATLPLLLMSLSSEEKPLLIAGGRTASPGAAETRNLGAGWER